MKKKVLIEIIVGTVILLSVVLGGVIAMVNNSNNNNTTTTTTTPQNPTHVHTEVIDPAIEATCEKTGLTEGKHCSTCKEVLLAQNEIPMLACTSSGWITDISATTTTMGSRHKECTVCGKIMAKETVPALASQGLEFELNTDGNSYYVKKVGTCTDNDIVIPSTYKGLPVTSIGTFAFSYCYNVTSVVIPDSVTSIGYAAFVYCNSLSSVIIPDSVKTIEGHGFYGCNLKSVTISEHLTSIGRAAFNGSTSLERINVDENNPNYKSIEGNLYSKDGKILMSYALGKQDESFTVPNTVEIIDGAFHKSTHIKNIIILDGVTNIGGCSFDQSTLESIVIPKSVVSIGEMVFMSCDLLTSVNYAGTVEQWNNITKASGWNANEASYVIYCIDGEIAKDGTITYYNN